MNEPYKQLIQKGFLGYIIEKDKGEINPKPEVLPRKSRMSITDAFSLPVGSPNAPTLSSKEKLSSEVQDCNDNEPVNNQFTDEELLALITPERTTKTSETPKNVSSMDGMRLFRPRKPTMFYSPETPTSSRSIKRSFEADQDPDDSTPVTARKPPRKALKLNTPKGPPPKIPELPAEYEQVLEATNFQTKGRKQADDTFGVKNIKGYDLYSLRTRAYVNDIIIDTYLQMVSKRSIENSNHRKCYALGTYISQMLASGQDLDKLVSWVKDDLFEFELIFLPINQESHWFLFVADLVNRNYFIYDSLHYGNYTAEFNQMKNFLKCYAEKRGKDINWEDWSDAPTQEQIGPDQSNGVDCGVFLCQYVEHLSRNAPLDFTQAGMNVYRKIMLYELLTGELYVK